MTYFKRDVKTIAKSFDTGDDMTEVLSGLAKLRQDVSLDRDVINSLTSAYHNGLLSETDLADEMHNEVIKAQL